MKHTFPTGTMLAGLITLSANHAIATPYQETLLVTATRTPIPVIESLASATVISREKIERLQPLDVVNILERTPGLDIGRNGGPGASTTLYTRGTANGHTLILVDGQRIGSATQGSASLQYLSPEQIERIEVVRGARSSLYGSDAIGGVIQIFTRDGRTNPSTWISSGTGSNHLQEYAAGTNGGYNNFYYGLNLSHLDTHGINNLDNNMGLNPDDDAYRNSSANINMGYGFDNGADIRLSLLDSTSRSEYDNASKPENQLYSKAHIKNVNLHGSLPVTSQWLTQLSLGQGIDDANHYSELTSLRTSKFRTEREQLFWQNDFTVIDGQVLTVAYDYYEDEVDSSSRYMDAAGNPISTRNNHARLAAWQGQFTGFDMSAGLRKDDNEEFGTHTTGNMSIGINLGESHKIIASWSEGFKAPTFNDLYWPASGSTAGNPDLVPEQSENIELSLRGQYDSWHWTLTGFENDVDNLINWARGTDMILRPYNVNTAEISGGEIIIGTEVASWLIDASYTYVETRDSKTDKLLPNRARSNFVVNIDRPLGHWLLGFSLKAQDKRYINATNSDWVSGYATADLRAQYQLTPKLKLGFSFNNLFDKDYQLTNGYNQDGRNWKLKMTYSL